MIRKLFVFCAITAFGTALVFAQTPPQKAEAPMVRSFSWNSSNGYLGVQTIEVTKENFGKFGLRDVRGVAIEKVIEGSPAAAAGLQTGDVIVALNGEAITSSRKLSRLITEVSPDHSVKLSVVRAGTERELAATVGKQPMPKFENGNFDFKFDFPKDFPNIDVPDVDLSMLRDLPRVGAMPGVPNFGADEFVWHFGNSRQIGIGITPLSKQLAAHFGVESGVMIDDVRENSPAAKAGLKAGDIITEIEGKAVRGDGDLIRAIGEKKEGDISLTIVRSGNRHTVKVTPEESKGGFNFDMPAPRPPGKVNLMPATPGTMPIPMPATEPFFRGRVI